MALREELDRQGNWLFRWRSYLPLAVICLLLTGMRHFSYPGQSERLDALWEGVCMGISLLGLAVRVLAIGYAAPGTSGTNTRRQVAETLNTTGMYSIVRHPLYLGNLVIWFGVSLFLHAWLISVLVLLVFLVYYERIVFAEEEFLRARFGDRYLAWAGRTPALLPNPVRWRAPGLPFSWRKAVKNEYKSLAALIAVLALLEITGDAFLKRRFVLDRTWLVILAVGALVYAAGFLLKTGTGVLDDGR